MLTTMLAILGIAVMNIQALAMPEKKENDYAKKMWVPDHGGNDLRTDIKKLTQRVDGLSSRLLLLIDTNSELITKNLMSLTKKVDEMANYQMSVSRKVDEIKSGQLSLSSKVDNITGNQVSLATKVDKISDNQVTLSRNVDEIDSEVRKFHPRSTQVTKKSTPTMTTSTTDVTTLMSSTPKFNASTRASPSTTPHGGWVYYPQGTHHYRARRFYPNMNLTYIGYGWYGSSTARVTKYGVTFEGCMSWCWQGRKDKGDNWNGVEYSSYDSWCACVEHDTGHKDDGVYLHYRFHK